MTDHLKTIEESIEAIEAGDYNTYVLTKGFDGYAREKAAKEREKFKKCLINLRAWRDELKREQTNDR